MQPWGALVRWLFAAAVLLISPHSIAEDETPELVVIVHPKNPVTSVNQAELAALFTSSQRFWPHGPAVVALNAAPMSPERVAFDRAVLRMGPDEVARFWVQQQVRGVARPPRKVPSGLVAVSIVSKLENSIAYVRSGTPLTGVRVIAKVRNGRVEPQN